MSSYMLGALVRVNAAVTDAGVPVDPATIVLNVTDPTGAITPYTTPTHDGAANSGLYHQDVPATIIGRYLFEWISSGTVAVGNGEFTVTGDDGSLSITDGPNALWCSASDVLNRCGKESTSVAPDVALDCAVVASNLLYVLSGRQFIGSARTVFRPCARPRWASIGSWASWFTSMTGSGWVGTWGIDYDPDGAVTAQRPPEVDLGVYPLTRINEVKIDGVVIPATEYRIDDYRTLVRVRPSINSVPTQRYGWPVWQNLALPPTEPGTWSVDAVWGMPPPPAGASAAALFGAELAKARTPGIASLLPQRVLNITRQGVSIAVRDPMEYLAQGFTGIYEVDLFIRTYNPARARHRSRVWSPDMDRSRHTTG